MKTRWWTKSRISIFKALFFLSRSSVFLLVAVGHEKADGSLVHQAVLQQVLLGGDRKIVFILGRIVVVVVVVTGAVLLPLGKSLAANRSTRIPIGKPSFDGSGRKSRQFR